MKQELLETLAPHGQQHLLRFWDELDERQRRGLVEEIRAIDPALIARLVKQRSDGIDWAELARRAEPPPAIRLDGQRETARREARTAGEAALREGRVGVLLVAGGQGTRLGFDPPKGMYPIGPVTGATLFQIHIEKVLAAARRYDVRVPLYLMTSPATHEETVAFLEQHDRFGLPRDDLFVFCQGTMPAVDAESGRILLDRKDHLALSPDGHGGTVRALDRSGAIGEMRKRGIATLFYFQVDNPLAPVCDPELIGRHLVAGSHMTTVVVAKESPHEPMGNVVSLDGRVRILEYSDLPKKEAERKSEGADVFWAGNTAIHVFDVSFLAEAAARDDALPFHIAHKKVPCLDESGRRVEPDEPNALKFERFIFDLLPQAENALVVQMPRDNVFAPLKNREGKDSPQSVKESMSRLHRRRLEALGVYVEEGALVEMSPLFGANGSKNDHRM